MPKGRRSSQSKGLPDTPSRYSIAARIASDPPPAARLVSHHLRERQPALRVAGHLLFHNPTRSAEAHIFELNTTGGSRHPSAALQAQVYVSKIMQRSWPRTNRRIN
ncbi:expressed unknown protein [Ectocarpus siliculosus]|uniref:Uncharacterized protein n=1 Tax=Ectocarpus siliculosus TaxID=2880 RepID=D8LK24_ECTSI|nr:expressed unknown protein [Ectocarpus siliculosus]|eukprot:CBN74493.1 expressed unknown protein [Ectocarpus siliculosus]